MRIKFLHTTSSENPAFPFQAGQVIEVPELTPAMRSALAAHQAVLLSEPEPEAATIGMSERAVKPRGKGHSR
jgi:hypothetical protein